MTAYSHDVAAHALGYLPASGGDVALLGALFLAGLVGGMTHCAGMCGPFVLAQVSMGLDRIPATEMREFSRLRGAALVPYHLGRLTTYSALGALAAAIAGELVSLTGFRWLAALLLALAAAAFLLQGVSRGSGLLTGLGPGSGDGRLADALSRLAGPLLWGGGGALRRYALGVVLGFLPCGLLYGALAAAASRGDALFGAVAMAGFTVGTVPGLVGVGLIGHYAMRRGGGLVGALATSLMVINAGLLGYLAWRLVA
jgi:sulfite exporter TauE/SafE